MKGGPRDDSHWTQHTGFGSLYPQLKGIASILKYPRTYHYNELSGDNPAKITPQVSNRNRNWQQGEAELQYLATSFNCEFINLRTDLYRRSQALSREVAQIRKGVDCFRKPKKSAISNSCLL